MSGHFFKSKLELNMVKNRHLTEKVDKIINMKIKQIMNTKQAYILKTR